MGGSSKSRAPVSSGPQTAGGPTPTLTQANPYYPSYPTYTPQTPSSSIGLSIPTDINSLRQMAANVPTPMLVSRTPFQPRGFQQQANPSMAYGNTPAPNFMPQMSYIPVNPDPNANRPANNADQERLDAERAYAQAVANGGGGGSSWSSK